MNRRAFCQGLAAAAAVSFAHLFTVAAFAQGARTFSRIVVDTKPLEARGGRGAAVIVGPRLQQSLQREFAGRMGRGPVLIVRVHTVLLSGVMTGGGDSDGGVPSDYLEGEIVVGQERIPMLVSVSSDSGGTWYVPGYDERRMHALADGFASWARRRV